MACALKKHNQEILGGGLSRKIQEEEMNCRQARWDSGRAQAWNSYQPSKTTPSMKLTCPGKLRWTTSVNSKLFLACSKLYNFTLLSAVHKTDYKEYSKKQVLTQKQREIKRKTLIGTANGAG